MVCYSFRFSNESRFCLTQVRVYSVERRPGERSLPECIRLVHMLHFKFHGVGHLLELQGYIWGKVTSFRCNSKVNPVILQYLHNKMVFFFSRTTHIRIGFLRRNVLFVVCYEIKVRSSRPYLREIRDNRPLGRDPDRSRCHR